MRGTTEPRAESRGAGPSRLRQLLAAQGWPWPAPVQHFETLGSTNDWLRERARCGAPEWTVVVADRQTAGRGRQGHVWISPPGNLHLSVLLRPVLLAGRETLLPLLAGVAVGEALAGFGVTSQLKWPNDVLADGRKIAGILAESSSGAAGLEALVLGMGVNVAAGGDALPPELRAGATSVVGVTGCPADPIEIAAQVLARLRVWYHALERAGGEPVLAAWRSRSVPWWGRSVEVRSGAELLRGVVRDVDERGALLLDVGEGRVGVVLSGEVRELRLA